MAEEALFWKSESPLWDGALVRPKRDMWLILIFMFLVFCGALAQWGFPEYASLQNQTFLMEKIAFAAGFYILFALFIIYTYEIRFHKKGYLNRRLIIFPSGIFYGNEYHYEALLWRDITAIKLKARITAKNTGFLSGGPIINESSEIVQSVYGNGRIEIDGTTTNALIPLLKNQRFLEINDVNGFVATIQKIGKGSLVV
ncbi:MAG: hypothetical protein WCF77_04485 [Minisyncoccia bacterium]